MMKRIAKTLEQLPADEARRIINTVFGELLAHPELTDAEREYLRRRRRELLGRDQVRAA